MFITAVRKSNSSAKERTGDNKIIREPCPSRQLMKLKDPRIVRVSRAFGGKDRHSKVQTIRGLRDRRVRLSVSTAIQLYDLQDRLGFNQPSKVVDWLLNVAQNDIDELPPLQIPPGGFDQLSKANQTQETHSSLMELNMGNVNENVERFSSYADSEGQNALRAHYMMNNCQHFTREDMNGNNSEIKVKKEQNPYGRKAQVSQISLSSNIPSQSNSYPSFNHWESSYLAYLGSHGFSSQQEELQNPVQYAPQLLLCPSSSTSSTFPTLGIPSSIEDTKQVNPFELQVPSLQNLPLNAFMSSVHTINQTMKSFESSMDTKQQFFWNQS